MRPLIGIPQCLDDRGRWRSGREYHYADAAYARALAEAGALPVYLPVQDEAASLLARVDGLLLPGGDDFTPDRAYPQDVRFDPAPQRQIDFDSALLAAALERDLPVLAICYGMQLLALHAGGALHFHLPVDLPDAGGHHLDETSGRHPVRVEAPSLLARLVGEGERAVNSRHHQAVSDPGAARVVARADDGLIEALELEKQPFALGVQWHPETLEPAHRKGLFGGFVAACRGVPTDAGGGRSGSEY